MSHSGNLIGQFIVNQENLVCWTLLQHINVFTINSASFSLHRFFIFIFECHCSSEQISCTIKFTGILLKKIHKPTKHVNINTVTPTNHHFYSRVNNKNWKLLFYRRDHLKLKVNVHLLLKKVKSKIVQVQDSYGWWKCKKCKKTKFSKSNSSDSSLMKTLIPTYK